MRKTLFLPLLLLYSTLAFAADAEKSSASNYYNMLVGKNEVNYEILFKEALEKVQSDYVDQVPQNKLYESAIEGMLSSLDPHSTFLNEKEFYDLRQSTKGEFGGLGLEVTMEKGFVKVISPYEDSPAFRAGIKVGDYITSVDDVVIKGMTLSEAVEKLRGKPRTKVKLTIYRESTNENLEFNIARELIKIIPVKSRIVAGDIAVIKITAFSDSTSALVRRDFFKLYDSLKERGNELKGVILDLRWNPGGLLEEARSVSELFLDDAVVVSTKGRIPEANQIYKSRGSDITDGIPIVVLINGGSASASEIVAGALQDNKRALLVGTKTFGKGSVQTIIPVTGGNALKMTTSRYYTPSGRAIQANGIVPDVIVDEALVTPVKNKFSPSESSLVGHLAKEQDKAQPKTQAEQSNTFENKDENDFQLLRAIDVIKGMALYSERLST